MSKIIKLTGNGASMEDIALKIAGLLKLGKVVAIPTDTVYGIASLAQNSASIKRIYNMKSRETKKPLAICVADIDDIPKWATVTVSKSLLNDLFPGPVTTLMKIGPTLNVELNPGAPLVAIRIPNHKFVSLLSHLCGEPLALTSANISSTGSCLSIEDFEELWPKLDIIVDGGPLGKIDPKCLGSTIVDLSIKGFYRITRDGCFLEETKRILHLHSIDLF